MYALSTLLSSPPTIAILLPQCAALSRDLHAWIINTYKRKIGKKTRARSWEGERLKLLVQFQLNSGSWGLRPWRGRQAMAWFLFLNAWNKWDRWDTLKTKPECLIQCCFFFVLFPQIARSCVTNTIKHHRLHYSTCSYTSFSRCCELLTSINCSFHQTFNLLTFENATNQSNGISFSVTWRISWHDAFSHKLKT